MAKNKFSTFLSGVVIAIAMAMFVPSTANATWGWGYSHSYKSKYSYMPRYNYGHTTCRTKCTTYKNQSNEYRNKFYRTFNYGYYTKYLYCLKKFRYYHNYCKVGKHGYHGSKGKHGSHGSKGKHGSHGSHGSKGKYGKVCGKVFEDSNDNGAFDKDTDKRLGNVSVKVTDANGNEQIVKTDTTYGLYCANNVAVGTATIDIIESTLPANAEQVVGTDPTTVEIKANTNNWEEYNGYVFAEPTGTIHGTVFYDANSNGQKDANETGVAGISIMINDAGNNTYTVSTDANGDYSQSGLVVGEATVTIDESTLPTDANLTVGENPSTVIVVSDDDINAGDDGYDFALEP